MTASVVPALIDALISTAESALPGVNVSDGFPLTADPGSYLCIGVQDPDADGYTNSADVQQEWSWAGATQRAETGEITCAALSWNGDGDPKAARDAAYAAVDALADALRANPSLDVAGVAWTSFATGLQLNQAQDSDGAIAQVLFRIAFNARI